MIVPWMRACATGYTASTGRETGPHQHRSLTAFAVTIMYRMYLSNHCRTLVSRDVQ